MTFHAPLTGASAAASAARADLVPAAPLEHVPTPGAAQTSWYYDLRNVCVRDDGGGRQWMELLVDSDEAAQRATAAAHASGAWDAFMRRPDNPTDPPGFVFDYDFARWSVRIAAATQQTGAGGDAGGDAVQDYLHSDAVALQRGTTLGVYTVVTRGGAAHECTAHFGHAALALYGASTVMRYPEAFGLRPGDIKRVAMPCHTYPVTPFMLTALHSLVDGRAPRGSESQQLQHHNASDGDVPHDSSDDSGDVTTSADSDGGAAVASMRVQLAADGVRRQQCSPTGQSRPVCYERLILTQGNVYAAFATVDAAADFRRVALLRALGRWLPARGTAAYERLFARQRSAEERRARTVVLQRSYGGRVFGNAAVLHEALERRSVAFHVRPTPGSSSQSVADDARLFHDYAVVIVASGSALANMHFALPGTAVVEVTPYTQARTWMRSGAALELDWFQTFALNDAFVDGDATANRTFNPRYARFGMDAGERLRAPLAPGFAARAARHARTAETHDPRPTAARHHPERLHLDGDDLAFVLDRVYGGGGGADLPPPPPPGAADGTEL